MKFAEMRLLLLHREWKLLKELEQFDNEFVEKLKIRQVEKDEIDAKVRFTDISTLEYNLDGK